MNLKINYHNFTTLKTSSKMKKIIIIILVLSVACSTKQQISKTEVSDNKSSIIEISLIEGESISFTIKNTTTESVYIYQPQRLHIEKFNNNSWEKLRILPCPCGAPCAKPIEKIEISKDDNYILSWDKHESWCGDKNEAGIPNTIRELAIKGKYRLRVLYSHNKNQKEILYKEFELK